MGKGGTTKLYHILQCYFRTEAICLSQSEKVLSAMNLRYGSGCWVSPASLLHLKYGCIQKMLQRPLLFGAVVDKRVAGRGGLQDSKCFNCPNSCSVDGLRQALE